MLASVHAQPLSVDAPIAANDKLHQRVLILDTHVDIPPDFGGAAYDPMRPGPRGQQVHLPTMLSGGLDAAFFIVFVGQGPRDQAGYAQALADAFRKFSAIHRLVATHANHIALARSAAEVRSISASGRLVALIGIENGYPMGKDIRLLDQFYDYGARYFGPVHVRHNDLADASVNSLALGSANAMDVPEHGGLSDLGRAVVKRLNELGIMVDVSHASDAATLEMIALSRAPVIASHSAIRSVFSHPRNLTDEALRAIAAKNGVVQVVAFDSYLRAVPEQKAAAVRALYAQFGVLSPSQFSALSKERLTQLYEGLDNIDQQWPKADVADLVNHIDYAVKLIGIDHVGIASDFNGGGGIRGWSNAAETGQVTAELLRRGYSETDIAKIWSENLLRVMEACETIARQQ